MKSFFLSILFVISLLRANAQEISQPNKKYFLITPSLQLPVNWIGVKGEILLITNLRLRWLMPLGLEYQDNKVGGYYSKWASERINSQILGGSTIDVILNTTWSMPFNIGLAIPINYKQTVLFESSINYSYQNFSNSGVWGNLRGFSNRLGLHIGCRFQPPQGKLFAKIGITTLLWANTITDINNSIFPQGNGRLNSTFNTFTSKIDEFNAFSLFNPELSVGWSFATKRK